MYINFNFIATYTESSSRGNIIQRFLKVFFPTCDGEQKIKRNLISCKFHKENPTDVLNSKVISACLNKTNIRDNGI